MLIHVFFQQFQTKHNLWVSETLYQSTALFHMFSICFPFFAIVSIFSIFVHHLSIMFHMFSIFFNINHPCFHLIPGILPCPGPKLLPQRVQDMLGEVRLPPVSSETSWSIWPSGVIMVNVANILLICDWYMVMIWLMMVKHHLVGGLNLPLWKIWVRPWEGGLSHIWNGQILTRWCPPSFKLVYNPINWFDISLTKTIVIGVINQLSYLGGTSL